MKWPTINLFPRPYDARAATRSAQWCFVVLLVLAALAVDVIEPSAVLTLGALVSVVLVAAATVIVMLPTVTLTPATMLFYLVPTLDGLAIVALRMGAPEATGGALLALVVPAVWLGTSGLARGVVLAGTVSLLAVVPDVVGLARGDVVVDAGTVSLVALVPIAMIATALFSFGLVDEASAATSAESEMRRLRDAIIETIDIGILVLDSAGEIVLVNRGVREHPIMEGVGTVGTDAIRQIRPMMADGVTPYPEGDGPILRAMMSDDSTDEVFWAHRADGTPHAFLARSTRVHDSDGKVIATVVAMDDVTRFTEAVQARDRLISAVSHELRTPLTAMKGYLELAREETDDESSTLARHLSIVDRHLAREHAIVEQFILAAESVGGQLTLRPENVELTAMARTVVAASTATAMRPEVVVHVVGDPVQCRVDATLTAAAVDALLSNAILATQGSGVVTLTVSRPDATTVRLEVADHGVGIPERERHALFEPFVRTRHAETEALPGVGLGLTLVKQIVDAHGGSVEIDTAWGVGTTVVVLMPTGKTSGDGGI